jgi:hypothetical protein
VPLSGPYPFGEQSAIAEVRLEARGRADLLAGMHLGLSITEPVDQIAAQMIAQASLGARAGADMEPVARSIPTGVARGEQIHAAHRVRRR